jgi:hypothetical protein
LYLVLEARSVLLLLSPQTSLFICVETSTMKYLTLVPSLLAAVAYASPIELETQEVQESAGFFAESPFGSTQDGFKVLPRLAETPLKDGATRSPKSWGPYTIQSSKMVQTFVTSTVPCAGCYVTAMEATIR